VPIYLVNFQQHQSFFILTGHFKMRWNTLTLRWFKRFTLRCKTFYMWETK